MRRTLVIALALGAAAGALALPTPARAAIPWCGTPVDEDRFPDAVSAYHWHVYYAYPADGRDRLVEVAPRIAADIQRVSAWWRREDSSRAPRFDLFDFPGCTSEFGRLDITRARLPRPSAAYAQPTTAALVGDVPKSVFRADKAVLVYYDGSFANSDICGVGRANEAVIPLANCGLDTNDGLRATVVAHELLHGYGAVPRVPPGSPGPPNACPRDPGHVCDSTGDLLDPFLRGELESLVLDFGRDDYYAHPGSWPDVRDSILLEPFDAADRSPPTAPARPSATSLGTSAVFSWGASQDASRVTYRVYDTEGNVRDLDASTSFSDSSPIGEILTYHVRAADPLGYLSTPVTIRFKVGFGLVDANGNVTADTVAPSAVTGLRLTVRNGRVFLSWRRASDTIGIRGYRIRIGDRTVRTVRATSTVLALRAAAGRIVSVAAVDGGGNLGRAASRRAPRR